MFTKKIFLRVVALVVFLLPVGSVLAFEIASGHSLDKIRRDGADLAKLAFHPRVQLEIAGEEAESFQLVVVPDGKELKDVKVVAEPLKSENGSLKLRWHLVEYVRTGNPSYDVEYVGWWPDPLMPAGAFDVAADRVQPLWFTVHVGPDVSPGVYKGSVVIEAAGQKSSVPVSVRVRNFALPRPGTLAAPFGVYKRNLAQWYGKDIDIETFFNWCEFMTQYRLTPKNIGYEFVERKTVTDEATGEKTLELDMSALQETVGKLADKHFAPYSYGFYRGTDPVQAMACWEDWKKQGFPEDVYLYGKDEPTGNNEVFQALRKTYINLKEKIPEVTIMQTGNCDRKELIGVVDVWCPKSTIADRPFFKERLKAGEILWQYVCVSPVLPSANFYIDEPAIDHRILFWQTKQLGATGFLYWSIAHLNGLDAPASGKAAFPDAPLDMRKHGQFLNSWVHVNGDGLLAYPGRDMEPLPSIRIEVIRDGIEDFEYLTLLEKLTAQVRGIKQYQNRGNKTIVQRAEELAGVPKWITRDVDHYTKDPQVIFGRRKAIGDMIEQLTDILENQDYALWK